MSIFIRQTSERLVRQLIVLAIFSCFVISGAKAQPQNSQNAMADRDRGIQLYRQGNTKGAIAHLRIAAKKNKTDAEVWYYLGLALTTDRQFKEASTAFESALKTQPNLAKARAGLAFTLLLRSKLKEALDEGQQTLVTDPKMVDAHYVVGVVYLRSGEAAKALEHANAALRLNAGYARGYLLKSQALVALSDESLSKDMREKLLATYKDAIASMERYLQLSTNKSADEVWREHLEALKSTAELIEKTGRTIFWSNEVSERARVLSKPEPPYTESARQNGVSGTVVLRAVFAADGRVKHISVIKGLPDGLTERAFAAARAIKFVPAKKDGSPVSMWMQLEYNFNLY